MPNSLLASLLSLNDNDRQELLASLTEAESEALYYDWPLWSRPEQLTPDGDWRIWLILAGRGWGKSRTGAEDVKAYGLAHPKSRIAIVAATFTDARDTCVEGESGLLACLPPHAVSKWNRSLGELILTNGTRYKLFSADEPERLRGPQHHRAWCDELGAWQYPQQAFDMLMFGLRLGDDPRAVVTTTPRPIPLIKSLMKRVGRDVVLTKRSTYDNAMNLAPAFIAQIVARYEGSRLGAQELNAEILDDNPDALWKRDVIEVSRVTQAPDLSRIVVAVDPAVTSGEDSDETGIVAVGCAENGHGYVLADRSMRGTPIAWASEAVALYHLLKANCIVAEVNQGGDMVEATIRMIDPSIPFKAIHASRGKYTRAEPVATLYEQGRVHHVGLLPLLEDQQCSWVQGDKSPDRLDALVHGLTELLIGKRMIPLADEPDPAGPEPEQSLIAAIEEAQRDPFAWADRHQLW
jgi:phage terminase large subunit-like protein